MLDEILIIAVRGVGLGSIFALVAMSYNVVKVSSGVLNFAQGNLVVLGGAAGYVGFALLGGASPSAWLLVLPLAALAVAVLSVLQGMIVLWPMREREDDQSWLITTMAFSVIVGSLFLLVQGPNAITVRSVFPAFDLLGTRVPAPYALAFGLAVFWWLALRLFMTRTLSGLAMSALFQNPLAARAAGLKVRRLQLTAFAISGLIAGSAGFVAGPLIAISADSGFRYALAGFVALVVGGLGSNLGALVAGPLIGVIGMLTTYRLGAEFQGLVSLLLLVAMLVVRPQGLFGRSSARKV